MIHEKVGDYLSTKINKDSYEYYLGLLAPDTPNLEGFAPKEERWMAHQRRKDYGEWRKSLKEFYAKEKNNYNEDFIIGYYIHILTDIVFDDFLYLKVRDEIEKTYSREESHNIMRSDMDKYYFEGIERIKKVLKESNNTYNILNVKEEKLLLWKEKQVNLFSKKNGAIYINENVIEELQEQVFKELMEMIEA